MQQYNLQPIGVIHSGYKEKFGIPRQPGLVNSMVATIELLPPFNNRDAVRGLEQCSHIWLTFIFSECVDKGWQPTVRPPRLGGNQRLGVFATRSPFRPNHLGLSPVKLDRVTTENGKVLLYVSGADLLDQTPIIDIKPYLPYSDLVEDATFTLADRIETLDFEVKFTEQAEEACRAYSETHQQPLRQQIVDVLRCDPRPAYKKSDTTREYGIRLHDLNIRWRISDSEIEVLSINTESAQC